MAESLEVQSLRTLARVIGAKVTDVSTPGVHAAGSYHYAQGTDGLGLAVDLAGETPSRNSPELTRIYLALEPMGPMFAELIYAGFQWKNGRQVRPYDHADNVNIHVHVAVPKGFRYAGPPIQEAPQVPDASIPQSQAKIVAAFPTPTGLGYTIITADGAVFCFGDARFFGRIAAPVS